MGYKRSITTDIWQDNKIFEKFTDREIYVFLYILTSPQGNLLGCFEFSIKLAAQNTKLDISELEQTLFNLENKHHVIRYDENTKEIFIMNWYKYNWVRSEKTLKGLDTQFSKIKSEIFKDEIKKRVYNTYPANLISEESANVIRSYNGLYNDNSNLLPYSEKDISAMLGKEIKINYER